MCEFFRYRYFLLENNNICLLMLNSSGCCSIQTLTMSHLVCYQINDSEERKKKLQFLLSWAIKTSVDRHIHVSWIFISEIFEYLKTMFQQEEYRELFILFCSLKIFPLNMITWTSNNFNAEKSSLKFRSNNLFYCFLIN